jgi:hypothetical protein
MFEPIGITDMKWARQSVNTPSASGALRMRARDLTKVGQLVVARGAMERPSDRAPQIGAAGSDTACLVRPQYAVVAQSRLNRTRPRQWPMGIKGRAWKREGTERVPHDMQRMMTFEGPLSSTTIGGLDLAAGQAT